MAEILSINKTLGSFMHQQFCKTCRHEPRRGTELPCCICWNPPGDMWQAAPPATAPVTTMRLEGELFSDEAKRAYGVTGGSDADQA